VLGCCGSGKSHLSRRLAARLSLPLVHLDDLYWGPGWTRPDPAAWEGTLRRTAHADEWIIDGNHFSSLEVRIARADLAIFLDLPMPRALASVVWRDVRRLFSPQDLPARVRDASPNAPTSPGHISFWAQVIRFNRTTRPRMLAMIRRSGVPFIHLKSRSEARRIVASLP
jgi:hypothetical protein